MPASTETERRRPNYARRPTDSDICVQPRSTVAIISGSQPPCTGIELTRPQTKRREPQRQTHNTTGDISTALMLTPQLVASPLTGHRIGSFRITVIDANRENSLCEDHVGLMKTTREITAAEHPGANSRRRSLTRESFEDNQRGKHFTADNQTLPTDRGDHHSETSRPKNGRDDIELQSSVNSSA